MDQLKERLRERGLTVSGRHTQLVQRLLEDMEVERADDEEDGEAEEDEDDGVPEEETDEQTEAVLERLRAEAPRIARSELVEGRAFFCWNDNERGGYFPMVCKADIQPNKGAMHVLEAQWGGRSVIGDRWGGRPAGGFYASSR